MNLFQTSSSIVPSSSRFSSKTGNNEFLSAEKQTRELLLKSPLPEVKYFMERFIPAFELNLDELGTLEEEV